MSKLFQSIVVAFSFLFLSLPAFSADSSLWIDFKGTAVKSGDKYILLDWEGKRGLELKAGDVKVENAGARIRVGAVATQMIRSDGTTEVMAAKGIKPMSPDLRTCCIGLAQTCCANGRVIHACLGVAGCDFGDDGACN